MTVEPLIASFLSLGRFSSLVYVRQIHSNKDRYIDLVKNFVTSLVDSLLVLDNHLISMKIASLSNISLKPKVHLLPHLYEDILRFGCALNFETEKGEQFNKFIREHLFQTNRQNTSRDVAVRFGKQFMFRFIYNGGAFLICRRKRGMPDRMYRSKAAYCISNFVENHPEFGKHFLEGRENVDYTYGYSISSSLSDGFSGLFKGFDNRLFFGRVRIEIVRTGDRNIKQIFIQPYLPAPNCGNAPYDNLMPLVLTAESNVVVFEDRMTGELVEVLDMETNFPAIPGGRLVNINKFGTFWSMIIHFSKCYSLPSMEIYFNGYKRINATV